VTGTYWIRLKGVGVCARRQLQQFAVLTYYPDMIKDDFLSLPLRPFPTFDFNFGLMSVSHKFEPVRTCLKFLHSLLSSVQSLNHPNTTCGVQTERKNHFCITDLLSYVERPEVTEAPADYQFILGFVNRNEKFENVYNDDFGVHFMGK
jgi:hypothetical protein